MSLRVWFRMLCTLTLGLKVPIDFDISPLIDTTCGFLSRLTGEEVSINMKEGGMDTTLENTVLFELSDIDIWVPFSLSTLFLVGIIEHAIAQRTNLYGSATEYVIANSLFRVHSLPGTEIIAV